MPLPVRQLQLKHLDGQEGVLVQPYISAARIVAGAQGVTLVQPPLQVMVLTQEKH